MLGGLEKFIKLFQSSQVKTAYAQSVLSLSRIKSSERQWLADLKDLMLLLGQNNSEIGTLS